MWLYSSYSTPTAQVRRHHNNLGGLYCFRPWPKDTLRGLLSNHAILSEAKETARMWNCRNFTATLNLQAEGLQFTNCTLPAYRCTQRPKTARFHETAPIHAQLSAIQINTTASAESPARGYVTRGTAPHLGIRAARPLLCEDPKFMPCLNNRAVF